jgi:hypothetical protein
MKVFRAILAAILCGLLWASPSKAQFFGVTFTSGAANYPAPDFSECDFNTPTTFTNIWYIDPVNGFAQNDYTNGTNGAPVVVSIGGASGQGTATHPWSNLNALTATVTGYPRPLLKTANGGSGTLSPIAAGDEVLLNTGTAAQYGAISFSAGFTASIVNSTFLTIDAAPGQIPVFTTLSLSGATHFHISNITIQSVPTGNLLIVTANGLVTQLGLSKNIVFDNISISATDYTTASTWTTQAQYVSGLGGGASPALTGGFSVAPGPGITCTAMRNSHVFLIYNGITFNNPDHVLIQNTEVDHYGYDGIDYAGTFIDFENNYIHDQINLGDTGLHMDFMQGQSGTRCCNHDIWINGNKLIYQTDPNLPFVGTVETTKSLVAGSGGTNGVYPGITLTGGGGTGATADVTVAGNKVTVVTIVNKGLGYAQGDVLTGSAGGTVGWSITVNTIGAFDGGIVQTNDNWSNLFITNNLIVATNFPNSLGIGGCNDCVLANNTTAGVLVVNKTNIGAGEVYFSGNITVTNNIAAASSCTDSNVTMTNNVVMQGSSNTFCFGGSITGSVSAPGTYGTNIIDSGGINSELTDIDTVNLIYNFNLLSTAPARGFGRSALPRPLFDQRGQNLNSPVDAGALAFP